MKDISEEKQQDVIDQHESFENNRIYIDHLTTALTQAVRVIQQWHDMQGNLNKRPKAVIEEMWLLYFDYAPEMKIIREVLKEIKP